MTEQNKHGFSAGKLKDSGVQASGMRDKIKSEALSLNDCHNTSIAHDRRLIEDSFADFTKQAIVTEKEMKQSFQKVGWE
ncbi:hypothetical protein A5886_000440 [Enterococcus sp. 8G7_MSG3316]|uniref:Uncharacterized protein n=1 Tax=Candidatus Enterococcus testudinis TaxID=1834191 RepID=A0A242A399_9ENTE|nr:hypothetical protein [Enterococcus sp. 8G7_MSG3316]OTN75370.1 hypothetical protein A5886_000440 [Enterococcus sp. 8G7_MSG3316]